MAVQMVMPRRKNINRVGADPCVCPDSCADSQPLRDQNVTAANATSGHPGPIQNVTLCQASPHPVPTRLRFD